MSQQEIESIEENQKINLIGYTSTSKIFEVAL